VAARGPQTPRVVWVSGRATPARLRASATHYGPPLRIRRVYSSQTTLSADMRSGLIVAFQYFSPEPICHSFNTTCTGRNPSFDAVIFIKAVFAVIELAVLPADLPRAFGSLNANTHTKRGEQQSKQE